MGTHREGSTPAVSRLRMEATPCPAEVGRGLCWQLEFRVRGERVHGMLVAPQSDEPEPGLLIWVHGRTAQQADRPIPSQPRALLELHWPLVGPRRDPKLSPLLTQCVAETTRSATCDVFWRRFADQAAGEVDAALTAVQAQNEFRVGDLAELRLELSLPGGPPVQRHWRPIADEASDLRALVLDFLDAARSAGTA